MAEATGKDRWARASAILALLANCHRDPKHTRPFTPDDFSPFAARQRPSASKGVPITKANMHILKEAFCPK